VAQEVLTIRRRDGRQRLTSRWIAGCHRALRPAGFDGCRFQQRQAAIGADQGQPHAGDVDRRHGHVDAVVARGEPRPVPGDLGILEPGVGEVGHRLVVHRQAQASPPLDREVAIEGGSQREGAQHRDHAAELQLRRDGDAAVQASQRHAVGGFGSAPGCFRRRQRPVAGVLCPAQFHEAEGAPRACQFEVGEDVGWRSVVELRGDAGEDEADLGIGGSGNDVEDLTGFGEAREVIQPPGGGGHRVGRGRIAGDQTQRRRPPLIEFHGRGKADEVRLGCMRHDGGDRQQRRRWIHQDGPHQGTSTGRVRFCCAATRKRRKAG
jgi:hypothetical protein